MNFPPALNPLRRTSFAWLFPFTWTLVKSAAPAVPITIEVFLHHRFGARSGKILLQAFLLLVIIFAAVCSAAPPAVVPLFPLFFLAYSTAALGHWFSSRFVPQPEHVHSYSTGVPWPFWRRLPVSSRTVQLYIEPVLCYLFGWLISILDLALAQWLMLAAVALFIKGQVLRIRQRTRRLDALDNRILANQLAPPARAEDEPFVEARPAPPRAHHRRPRP